jgi:hypothetical protein
VGGDILILAKAESVPAGEAIVETIVDGHSRRFPIGVIPAQSGESKRIKFSPSPAQDIQAD